MARDASAARVARRWRAGLAALLALGLAPGTCVRSDIGTRRDAASVTLTPLQNRIGVSGAVAVTGVWRMSSAHGWFGGFSALVAKGSGGLVAGTDRGFLLDLAISGDGTPRAVPGSFRFAGITGRGRTEWVDLESLARDPATGTLWGGFELDNLVVRYAPDGTRRVAAPPSMAQWSINSGPETMERLADGRFLVIAEGGTDDDTPRHEALLFPRDPLSGGKPLTFALAAPAGYDPVDATQVPDGRVLILLRRVRYAIPARFDTAIAIADPAAIRAGGDWPVRVIARLEGGIFADNFEGLAFVPSPQDPARGSLWVVSDDNFSIFQRSLLVRFDFGPPSVAQTSRPTSPPGHQ